MPELPEVEIIKLGLEKKIIGFIILKIEVLNPKTFEGDPDLARGKKILRVWRRAKILGINLGEYTLLFHLKMSGQVVLVENLKLKNENSSAQRLVGGHPTKDILGQMPNRSTRVIIEFEDGNKLYFNDQRKFGWIKLMSRKQIAEDRFLNSLGVEPLEKEFTLQNFKERLLKHKKMPVKVAILDQSVVAGMGNIYASESCFRAMIDPRKRVMDLTPSDIKRLKLSIRQVLSLAVYHGGSSRTHYVNASGEQGFFLKVANVYNRQGKECRRCSGKIVKITLGGRGTYFCPNCQS